MRGFIYLDVVGEKKSKMWGEKVEWMERKKDLAEPQAFFLFKKQSCEKSAAL